MLVSLLNAHPQVTCFREVLNPAHEFIIYGVEGYDNDRAADRALRDADPVAFLLQRIFCAHPAGTAAVGFKTQYEQIWLVPRALEWLLAQDDLRVIHLRRRNLLRARVSIRIAQMTGVWMERKPPPLAGLLTPANALRALRHPGRATKVVRATLRPKRPAADARQQPIALSLDECRFYFNWVEQNAAQYDDAFKGHPLVTLYYEDLVGDRRRRLEEVQKFLGVRPQSLPVATRQQNPEPLRELIANYDELRAAFKDTKYAEFFD